MVSLRVAAVADNLFSPVSRWSLVVGPWSLVLGRWSLVVGPWSSVLVVGLGRPSFVGGATGVLARRPYCIFTSRPPIAS
ncbi:MAG: hypothetical protein DMG82_18720 [Acidobacteria bacterium]|nr:MAG: hypothetical protein DMG82_18720 [Acidobacteriota bacterium]PYX42818.1 MAG: hypothetical protein DMG83_19540 [Acidobacteriota bacterium]